MSRCDAERGREREREAEVAERDLVNEENFLSAVEGRILTTFG